MGWVPDVPAEDAPEKQTTVGQVSVVIPHYGDAEGVRALVALLREEAEVAEVVVVDDCSPQPLGSLQGARTMRRAVNGGFGAAVNTGVAATSGDLVLVLNSDVSFQPGFVQRLVTAAGPWQPALVGPAVRTDGVVEHTARRFPRAAFLAVERVRVLARFQGADWWSRAVGLDVRARPGSTSSVDWMAGVCLLLPRAAFDLVGGFDERYFMYAEEVDLQRRLADVDVPRIYLGAVELDHVGGASSDPARTRAWLAQSRATYAAKWGGLGRLRALLTTVAIVNLVTTTARRIVGRPVTPGRELVDDLRDAWRRPQRAR